MNTWLRMLFLVALAVGLALLLREHSGNVIIVAQPWRIELSLTLAVLLVLAAFIIAYLCIRLVAWLTGGPERFRSWRAVRSRKRDHELLESGWIHILEGRYNLADKEFSKLLGITRVKSTKVLAGLASARATHHMGEYARRDESLRLARETAAGDDRLNEAATTVAAEMLLDQNRPQDALTLLQPLQDASSRHLNATRVLLRAHRQLHNHEQVYQLTRLLLRRGVIEKDEAAQLIETATAARLRAAGPDALKPIWSDLRAEEKVLPDIALAAAGVHESAGNYDEAAKVLEAALNVRLDPQLLNAYSKCPPDQVARRLSKAEVWLKSHPDDSSLLAALGNLCLTGQLWGQGEHYLQRSMKIRSDVRIHALLGNLYDRLGRKVDAMKHWRLASGVAGSLPAISISQWLPAADTRSDPTLIDVESLPDDLAAETEMPMPIAASAADYDVDERLAEPGSTYTAEPLAPAEAPSRSSNAERDVDDGIDEYFDSAPIPGVDLSQTSDRPERGPRRH